MNKGVTTQAAFPTPGGREGPRLQRASPGKFLASVSGNREKNRSRGLVVFVHVLRSLISHAATVRCAAIMQRIGPEIQH